MKEKIKRFIYKINYYPFLKNHILFESNPDYSDNTKAVFDELIHRKYNQKYKLIWFVDNKEQFEDIKIKNVKFIERNKKIINKIKCAYYNSFSKYIIDCNKSIKKLSPNQIRFYLSHGTPLKLTVEACSKTGEFDLILATSEYFIKIIADLFQIEEEKIYITGLPRNDSLFKKNENYQKQYKQYNKIIVWMPTYRNHKKGGSKESITGIEFKYGVPCIENENELKEINSILKENNSLLILKLHPVEDTSKIKNLNLSNIELFDNLKFLENHTNVYDLLSVTDALITDYSSIYYDFLITKKQIGLAIPDIKEYSKHVKLLFNKYENNVAGEIIYTFNDLKKFINNVIENNDPTYEERLKKIEVFDKYHDDKSTKRVVDLIETKIKRK